MCLLISPVVSTVAGKGIRAVTDRKYAADAAKEADFPNPQAKLLAAAVTAGDLPVLKNLLAARPNTNARDHAGNTLLAYAIRRDLFEPGADIESLADGIPPVVRFTGGRNWEPAIYLVEKGARFDTKDAHCLSLDSYRNDWKDGVNGTHQQAH